MITCLQLLVTAGADFSSLGPGTFDSAFKTLRRAARFLFAHGANAASTNESGLVVLHAVIETENQSAAQFLLHQGANINAQADRGVTPLDAAKKLNLPRMVRFLREHGTLTNV